MVIDRIIITVEFRKANIAPKNKIYNNIMKRWLFFLEDYKGIL